MPRYGLDTGFFFKLFDSDPRARTVWNAIVAGEAEGVVSTITAYELSINALKGVLVREDVEGLLEELPVLCTVHAHLSVDDAQHAARIAWGNNLAMADVLILQGFLEAEVDHVVTTDRDFAKYEGGLDVEVL
jgi:predicted nucleic acid-binding protein